jgi:hypothetical protein
MQIYSPRFDVLVCMLCRKFLVKQLRNIFVYALAVARRVADRRQFSVSGCQLTVEPIKPGHPPPLFIDKGGAGVAKDSLLYVDLPRSVQVDSLRTFVTRAAGVEVVTFTFSTKPGVVLVRYVSAPGRCRSCVTSV